MIKRARVRELRSEIQARKGVPDGAAEKPRP
jgi:hypothetical protein